MDTFHAHFLHHEHEDVSITASWQYVLNAKYLTCVVEVVSPLGAHRALVQRANVLTPLLCFPHPSEIRNCKENNKDNKIIIHAIPLFLNVKL